MKIKAKKKFGQNFISDLNLIKKIVNILGNEKNQLVIEIGPGTGALTKELVKYYNKVIAIEIDRDIKNILNNKINKLNKQNFKLIISDILKINLKKLIEQERVDNQPVIIISNMPYYITSKILFKTLVVSSYLSKAIFMMQKEVAKRICAYKGENNYNNLSIACEFYAIKKYEFTVSKKMFQPIPKVDSAIISLKFYDKYINKVNNQTNFLIFIRKIFNNRRKTILNNLTNIINDKQKANKILIKTKIDANLRPEVIGLNDYIKIFNYIF